MSGALAGIVVRDASGSVAGEYCGRLFHDFGAEVWLDEGAGPSPTRALGPFAAGERSLTHLHLNRGKRAGRPDRRADVVLCAATDDAAAVAAAHPGAVVCQITPFGTDGPMAGWSGPEIVLQAASGMMNANGIRGRAPLYGVGQRASYAAGVAAYIQILVSLRHSARTGEGDVVRIDAAETAAAMAFPYVLQTIYNGTDRRRGDQEIPAGQVLCRGAWVCVWVYSNRFAALCQSLGLDACLTDPRFATVTARNRHWDDFFDLVQEKVADLDPDAWVADLQGMNVIAARAFRPSELRESRHLAARDYWQEVEIDGATFVLPGAPFRLSRTPARRADARAEDGTEPPRPPAASARPAGGLHRDGLPLDGLPLEGLRVLELTTAWAGPMTGRVLAWFGAESFHIESPTRTNTWRSNRDAPVPASYPDLDPGARPWDRVFTFNSQNVNKRSLVVDLKTPEGLDAVRRIARRCDVLLCNFRPGMLQRLGLDHATLAEDTPGIVVVEMPAFGLEGPESSYAALGPTMEMAAGMSAMIAYPGGKPTVTGPSYMDPIGGFNGAAAVLTALVERDRSGRGQHIELAQVEAAMQFIGPELVAGTDPVPDGNHVAHASPHNAYPTKGEDAWIVIACESEAAWRALAARIDPALVDDARFADLAARKANEAALDELIGTWTAGQEKHALAAALQADGIAAHAVMTAPDLAASPYLAHRGFFTELDHPQAGRHRHPGLPFHAARAQGSQRTAAPSFGEGNAHALREVLGLDAGEVARLLDGPSFATEPLPGV